ncbi:DUF3265 domain-containing protein [Vibrio parahaemolyticus]|nr:DUF3265 domain-containing protein [Vibrio parahaemolyticus]
MAFLLCVDFSDQRVCSGFGIALFTP